MCIILLMFAIMYIFESMGNETLGNLEMTYMIEVEIIRVFTKPSNLLRISITLIHYPF